MFQNAPPASDQEGFASPGPRFEDANVADPLSAVAATAEASGKPVAFIDAGVEDANAVIAKFGEVTEVHVLESDSDGVSQTASLQVSGLTCAAGDAVPASSPMQQLCHAGRPNPGRTDGPCALATDREAPDGHAHHQTGAVAQKDASHAHL